MSNVKLQASASGTGTVTIAPPVTNSDLTINLPANSGTVPTIASVVNNGVVYTNSTGAITSSSALTFDGTNLGVGTSSPSYKLDVAGVIRSNTGIKSITASGGQPEFVLDQSGVASWTIYNPPSNTALRFYNGVDRMTLDSSGNLGLGVTPSAWSGFTALQISNAMSLWSKTNDLAYYSRNVYYDGSSRKYAFTGAAAEYSQGAGTHTWSYAASGTAGNTISFTQAMTLDASGNLGINSTSPSTFGKVTVQVAGTTTPTNLTNVGPSSINLYAANNGSSTDGTTGIFGWNSTTGLGSGIGFSRENSGDWGTQIRFYTHPTSTTNIGDITERARIDSSGNLLVGATSLSTGGISRTLVINGASSAAVQFQIGGALASYVYAYSSGASAGFRCETSSTYPRVEFVPGGTGGVQLASAGATSWTSLSDERTKTDLTPIANASQKVVSLRAVTGRFKTDSLETRRSFLIAQDVQAVLPEAVSLYRVKDDDTDYLGLSYTDTIPLLVAAIQELKAEFDAYKATHP